MRCFGQFRMIGRTNRSTLLDGWFVPPRFRLMAAQNVRVSSIYMDAETQRRFDQACEELGWTSKSLVRQCIQAFFKVHQSFYAGAALADCASREMTAEDYYRKLRDKGEDSLSPYLSNRPSFGVSPLATIPAVPTTDANRRRYNLLTLGGYNLVLLRVARIVDLSPQSQIISRIVAHHFQTYWATNYQPQIELDKTCKFELKENTL